MYSRLFTACTMPRVMRAYQAQWVRTMARTTLVMPRPRTPVRNMARIKVGKVINASQTRMIRLSTQPPSQPDTDPTTNPVPSTSPAMTRTDPSDTLVPAMSRDNTSRPK